TTVDYVTETRVQKVPYTTTRVVNETREWNEAVTKCVMKTEKVARKVPYQVTKTVPKTIKTQECVDVPRVETYEVEVCVPKTVTKKVEVKVCKWVPCDE